MLVLELLDLGENLEVLLGILEVLPSHASHVVQLRLKGLLSPRHLIELFTDLLFNAVPLIVLVLGLPLQLLLLGLDLHQSAGVLIVVLLQLLQLATLLKQGL